MHNYQFQSTLPHGSDNSTKTIRPKLREFQSTLPHGSDRHMDKHHLCTSISIHAPSRERPRDKDSERADVTISIHAPSRERRCWLSCADFCRYFNPRSLTGATYNGYVYMLPAVISIHAPSRERHLKFLTIILNFSFQSTLPHGSDTT